MTSFRNCKAAWKRRLVPGVFLYIETEDEEIENSKYLLRVNNKKKPNEGTWAFF